MIIRGDVQPVIDAFILVDTLYWWLHPIERVNKVRGIDTWDGYHWLLGEKWRKTKTGSPLKPTWTPWVKRI